MKIYKAEKKDIIDLCNLWYELQEYHRGLASYSPQVEDWRSAKERELMLVLKSENSQIYVARENEKNVGYIRGWVFKVSPVFRNTKVGRIDEIFVKKEYRHQNAGRLLVDYMIMWFKGKGVSDIDLHVSPDNTGAKKFWEALGFKLNSIKLSMKV